MKRFCAECGAELPEEGGFCLQCGKEIPADAVDFVPVEPEEPQKRRLKWWAVALPVLAAMVVLAACLWGRIQLQFMPETVLAKASANTTEALSQRLQGTVWTLGKKLENAEQRYAVDLNADFFVDNAYMPLNAQINVDAQVDVPKGQMLLDFDVGVPDYNQELGGKLYLDPDCGAFSYSEFMDGAYYGITFDSVSEDLRSSKLFQDLSIEDMDEIEDAVEIVRAYMQQIADSAARQDEMRQELLDAIRETLSAVECRGSREALELDDETRRFDTVSFTLTEVELADCLDAYISIMEDNIFTEIMDMETMEFWQELRDMAEEIRNDGHTEINFHYYISNDLIRAIAIDLNVESDEEESIAGTFLVDYGTNPAVDDWTVTVHLEDSDMEAPVEISVVFSKETDGDTCVESAAIHMEDGADIQGDGAFAYRWDKTSGEMELTCQVNDVDLSYTLTVRELEDGFELDFGDILESIAAINGDLGLGESKMALTLTIRKGTQQEKPEYINLDQWTEDLLDILG